MAATSIVGRRFMSNAPPRFRVLGLQQVAIGGLDKGVLKELWGGAYKPPPNDVTCAREQSADKSLHPMCRTAPGVLGVPCVGNFRSEKENVDEDIMRLGNGPFAVEIDLMQPIDPAKAPKVHEPALNHIGLWVNPLREAVAALEAQGVRFTPGGVRKGAAGHDVAFIHPKGNDAHPRSGCGVLIELVQAPPDVVAAFERASELFPAEAPTK